MTGRPVLYYAPGGGLGHVRRAAKVAHALGFEDHWVLATSSSHAHGPWLAGTPQIVAIPASLAGDPDALRAWLLDLIESIRPVSVHIDAFPGGLFGECCGLPDMREIEFVHVARLLDWSRYCARLTGSLPRYARVLLVEALHPEHRAALASVSGSLVPLDLRIKGNQADAPPHDPLLWLVVHSEPLDEVLDLVAYAKGIAQAEGAHPNLVVLSACAPPEPNPDWLVGVDATDWVPRAGRLFVAAGFNTLLETEPWRERRHIVPMPRALDDQFERARRARKV